MHRLEGISLQVQLADERLGAQELALVQRQQQPREVAHLAQGNHLGALLAAAAVTILLITRRRLFLLFCATTSPQPVVRLVEVDLLECLHQLLLDGLLIAEDELQHLLHADDRLVQLQLKGALEEGDRFEDVRQVLRLQQLADARHRPGEGAQKGLRLANVRQDAVQRQVKGLHPLNVRHLGGHVPGVLRHEALQQAVLVAVVVVIVVINRLFAGPLQGGGVAKVDQWS